MELSYDGRGSQSGPGWGVLFGYAPGVGSSYL
jgi:hypothetical protein